MTGFDATKTTRNNAVNDDIVAKDTVNSIDPADVGNNIIQNLEALTPFIEAINNFTFYNGTSNPNDANGVEGDVYQQTNGGSSITIWRKTTTTWVIQDILPLGITFQNGIITGLRTQLFLDTLSVNVTSGSWAINNIIYSKAIPTVINYNAPEVGSDRIDTIYSDTNGDIIYLAGSPSGTPVKPTLPANTIEVDSIYVPAIGTGSAYLFSAGEGVDLSLYATISYVDTLDSQNVKLNPSSPQSGGVDLTGNIATNSAGFFGRANPSDVVFGVDLAIGDGDTGIKWVGDGEYDLTANNTPVLKIKSPGGGGAGGVSLLITPTTDATPANILTWDATTKEVKKVAPSDLEVGNALTWNNESYDPTLTAFTPTKVMVYDGADLGWKSVNFTQFKTTLDYDLEEITANGNLANGDIMIKAGNKFAYSANAYYTPEDNVQGSTFKTPGGLVLDVAANTMIGATSDNGSGGKLQVTGSITATANSGAPTAVVRNSDIPFENYLASGTGASTTITIPHGLTGITAASKVIVQPLNSASAGVTFATIGSVNIVINYTIAPAAGTNNLNYSILIKK